MMPIFDFINNSMVAKHQKEQLKLPVMEMFYSLQGEGRFTGRAAFFIRLAGCDVGCVWCDVKESWDATAHPSLLITDIISSAKSSGTNFVVVTGGEPLMHNLDLLTEELHKNGMECAIETSGSHPFSGKWDWVCLSPKKFKAATQESFSLANELKVVVFNKHDLKWAEELVENVKQDCQLYLQPEWDKKELLEEKIITYIKENTKWRLSLQTHKYLRIE